MGKIFKYLRESWLSVLAIVALLVVQAYCDLQLPQYTSDIVDVGIGQGGIAYAAPERMRAQTYSDLRMFLTEDEKAVLDAAYARDADGSYVLTEKGQEELKQIDSRLAPAMVLLSALQSGQAGTDLDTVRAMSAQGLVTEEQLAAVREQMLAGMGDMSDSIISARAVQFVQAEYEALGMDTGRVQTDYLLRTGGKMLGLSVLMMAAAILTGLLASRTAAKVGRSLRNRVYSRVVGFSNAEMDRFSTASLITRSTNDIQQVQMVIVMLLRMVLYAPIIGIGGVIKVAGTGTGMGWIIGVAVGAIVALVAVLMVVAMPKFKMMQTLVDRVNLVSREILTGIPVIRAFSREKFEEQRFDKANRELMGTQLFTGRVMNFMMPVMMLIMNVISVMIIWFGGKGVDMGTMQVGEMLAFITYTMQIVMAFLMLTMISIMLPRAGVAANRIEEVLNTEITIRDRDEVLDDKLGEIKGEIAFEDVSFRYPGAEEDALQHISFTAKPGQTMAIIGSTGCGKSTLLHLIPRFYDVTGGRITLDGVDIRDISQKKLRGSLGFVPQKGVLFSGTIASNIMFGSEETADGGMRDAERSAGGRKQETERSADGGMRETERSAHGGMRETERSADDRMREAAQIAQAEEFIDSKPDGYESPISQGGTNVSGGQRQRLSIARAIARNPKVFLFDDSFSALDYKTDVALRRALKEKVKDAAVIIVAQRISTILHADQILVLDNGRVVGKGTHEELLAGCEAYQEIAGSQLSEAELKGGKIHE